MCSHRRILVGAFTCCFFFFFFFRFLFVSFLFSFLLPPQSNEIDFYVLRVFLFFFCGEVRDWNFLVGNSKNHLVKVHQSPIILSVNWISFWYIFRVRILSFPSGLVAFTKPMDPLYFTIYPQLAGKKLNSWLSQKENEPFSAKRNANRLVQNFN